MIYIYDKLGLRVEGLGNFAIRIFASFRSGICEYEHEGVGNSDLEIRMQDLVIFRVERLSLVQIGEQFRVKSWKPRV